MWLHKRCERSHSPPAGARADDVYGDGAATARVSGRAAPSVRFQPRRGPRSAIAGLLLRRRCGCVSTPTNAVRRRHCKPERSKPEPRRRAVAHLQAVQRQVARLKYEIDGAARTGASSRRTAYGAHAWVKAARLARPRQLESVDLRVRLGSSGCLTPDRVQFPTVCSAAQTSCVCSRTGPSSRHS
jgi:hypothetical protein